MIDQKSVAGEAGSQLPVGAERGRGRRLRLRYELLGCALHGHLLASSAQAESSGQRDLLTRIDPDHDGVRWFRCLRCDAWIPMLDAGGGTSTGAASVAPVQVPLRGRPLRDRVVLRIIAIDRIVHLVLIGALAVAIFLFADHRQQLLGDYTRVLNRLQAAVGGPLTDTPGAGILRDLDRLFSLSPGRLYLYGIAIAAYALINGIEAVGLWGARRWAEYLTLIEVGVFLPIEVHELFVRVSPLKLITLVLNLAVFAYLLFAHRLFGLRGGGHADRAEKERDTGWPPLQRTTPWPSGSAAPVPADGPSPADRSI